MLTYDSLASRACLAIADVCVCDAGQLVEDGEFADTVGLTGK